MWRFVDKSGECWVWTGYKTPLGYGTFSVGGHEYYTHRLAWELTKGPIAEGMEICHRCDHPPCCNPEHLFVGTHGDNIRDMVAKGRQCFPNLKGEAHPNARLTETDVISIRTRYATGIILQRELGAEYGVDQVTISRIVRGAAWAHCNNP